MEPMPELLLLRPEVAQVLGVGRNLDRHLFDDGEAEALEADDLARVVREDADGGEAEVSEDLAADPPVARVGREAELEPEQEPEPEPDPAPEPESEPEPDVQHAPTGLRIPDGYRTLEGDPHGEHIAVAVVVSRFNGEITTRLLERALDELEIGGVSKDAVTIVPVPGAFELPLAAMALAKTRRYACIIALGCVIRGDTSHYELISSEAASGLQLAAIETGTPVSFGVLTCENRAQAEARVGRAEDAVRGALEMADVFSKLRAAAGH